MKFSFLKHFGVSAYLNGQGEMIFRRIGMTAERVKTDPAFRRTRECSSEFGYSAKIAKLFRVAFAPCLEHISNSRLTGDLVKTLLAVIKSDVTNPRGALSILEADIGLLKDYEFNEQKQHAATSMPVTSWLNEAKTRAAVEMKAFIQKDSYIHAPDSATHVKIYPILAAINPVTGSCQSFYNRSLQPVSRHDEYIPAQQITADITIPGPFLLLTAVCIEFVTCRNNEYYQNNSKFNSLTIVSASRA